MSLFLRSGKNEVIPVSHYIFYIFDFISTKCKIMYQFLLFPRSIRNLTDFLYFFTHKFVQISTISKSWIDSLYIFIFLILFHQSVLLPQMIHISSKKWKKYQIKKLENTFNVYFRKMEKTGVISSVSLHISFHFYEV